MVEKETLTEFAFKLESILYRLLQLDGVRYDGTDFQASMRCSKKHKDQSKCNPNRVINVPYPAQNHLEV